MTDDNDAASTFFGALLALFTFRALRERSVARAQADGLVMALTIKWPCIDCEDDVYLDGKTLKHVSNRQVMRSTPHGRPHQALAYLPPLTKADEEWDEQFEDDTVPVVDNRQWRKQ